MEETPIPFPSHIRDYVDAGYLYTIRLDLDTHQEHLENLNDLEGILAFLQAQFCVVYQEISTMVDKPHLQGYFFRNNIISKYFKENKISQFFRDNFPYYTGTKRSISLIDKESYLSYCSKDGKLILKKFPPQISGDQFLSCIPTWKPIKKYLKSSAIKSLKNDLFDINPLILADRRKAISEIVRIHITHKRPFTDYNIISHYNVLLASTNLKDVVDRILEKMDS